jgi:7,8-dihydropterin-6-yl-methyl-4-(beta-D-ribofuranosyl)aminobenzene 5'-phosphate synthase
MIGIKVLLENTRVSRGYSARHGLSIAIGDGIDGLLLDVGPDRSFLLNARKMKVDLDRVGTVILSHSHYDHTGGLDALCAINERARIFLFDGVDGEYFAKLIGGLKVPVGLKCSPASKERIQRASGNLRIDERAWFIENSVHAYKKPSFNGSLYKKAGRALVPDDFSHEGILVVEDGGELVLFNSCSHNGVRNSIESAKKAFGGKRIRSYVGGFHFCDPMSRRHEDHRSLDELADYVQKEDIHLYTGHCTGEYCYRYMKERLGSLIDVIRTGSALSV